MQCTFAMGMNGDKMSESSVVSFGPQYRSTTCHSSFFRSHFSRRLLPSNDQPRGFEIVIMSDLLHFDASHDLLLLPLKSLLSKSTTSREYVAGNCTLMYATTFCVRENRSVLYGKEKMIRRKLNGTVLWKSLDSTEHG